MSRIEMVPLVGKPARWLTNTDRNKAAEVAASLQAGRTSRSVVQGYPKATDKYSADVLHAMGMVGLYDATEAET